MPLRFASRPASLRVRSPRATQAPRHQRFSTPRATHPGDGALPGTVVAYQALHVHLDPHVYLLVTVGSPLALPGAVRQMVTTVVASVVQER